MGQLITQTVTLETEVCCNCSVLFAVPDSLQRRRRADGDGFYCPNGHKQHYSESELDRVRKKLNEQTRAASDMADRATRAEKAKAELAKQMRQMKTRAAAGVCP